MINDDEDWIEVDEIGDEPRDPRSRSGLLVVPGIAVTEAAFAAESIGFVAARPVILVHLDEDDGEILDNAGELRAAGFTGATVADAEEWMSPRNEQPNPERDAAIIAARGGL